MRFAASFDCNPSASAYMACAKESPMLLLLLLLLLLLVLL
jgi:hypothetical protein